ncbi:hypothetical protein AWB91_06240 [Mycobacterium paraense]|uniref:DUF5067 domain-containing protein n=1 Tax=Mycobacterium paraense TaxID=767916 RepID=A0ABX3VT60_9MYCO|nr:hypothetical protein [Mycobacterium paraense]ORW33766.1 hypothetical protein AWB91_06240 [Mycobacterium paraense]ORW41994.1 hypothetical protein AWB88_11210 [Mycobacterium paraense]
MKLHRLGSAAIGLIIVGGVLLSAGITIGISVDEAKASDPAEDHAARGFMFQVIGLKTPNQGGHTINLFFHYRYNDGIGDREIPDYIRLRDHAVDYLKAADLSANPYWEVLNHQLCTQLKNDYPLEAISCVMQVVGAENPPPPPGYRSSIETIGQIEPLVVPGPANG